MGKTSKPKQKRSRSKEEKAHQMDKIIDGSLDLIREKGFHGFGMRALAKHIGMSQGNLYNYIASQRELWIAVRLRCNKEFKEKMQKIYLSSRVDTIETLKKIGNFVFEFAAEDFNRWKLMTVIEPPEPPMKDGIPFIGKIEENYVSTNVLDIVFEIIQRGHLQGDVQEVNQKLIGFFLYSIVLGITYTEYDLSFEEEIRESVVHDELRFEKKELRDLAFKQIENLLKIKKNE